MFENISKRREENLKYDAQQSILTNFKDFGAVWNCDQTLP